MNRQPSQRGSYRYYPQLSSELPETVQTDTTGKDGGCWFQFVKRALIGSMLLAMSFTALAADQSINKNWRSIAIKGYDPVAYFTMSRAVKGKSQFEYRWQDARWRFVSEEHMKLFTSNPEQYAPRFGGYCAEGMTLGRKASIDPQAWLIIEGELYLNYSIEVRDIMARNPSKTIEDADLIWESLQLQLQGQ